MVSRSDRCWSSYKHAVGAVDRSVNRALGNWGARVAARPVTVLVTALLFAIVLSLGIPLRIAGSIEGRSEKLWCDLCGTQTAWKASGARTPLPRPSSKVALIAHCIP